MKLQKLSSSLIVVIITIFISSCDGYKNVSGIIVDKQTREPIEKVMLKEIDKHDTIYTDAKGFFEIHYMSGFVFSSNNTELIVQKKGYRTDTIKIENGKNKTIELILN